METAAERTERTYIKLILGGVGGLLLIILLIWGSLRFYRNWQEGHLVRRAAAYMSGGDLKTASLNARRALQLNASNGDASRIIAEIAEKTGDRAAVEWRRKVLADGSASPEDTLALVRTALRFNDLGTAENALGSADEKTRQLPAFYAASGRLAEMKKDVPAAEQHWAKAAELAPDDAAYKFQLALVWLQIPDRTKRENALRVLEQLRSEPTVRAGATRTLIMDGVAHAGDSRRLRNLAEELQAYPDALFSDRILFLEILRQLHENGYAEYLARLKSDAPSHAADVSSLLAWMVRNGMSADAVQFGKTLPVEILRQWPVPIAIAESYAAANDGVELERLMRESEWPGHEFLRHAFLARALRLQDKKLPSEQELSAAQKEAAASPQMLSMLAQTVAEWGWQNEAVELLWALTKSPETQLKALEMLYAHYGQIADTSGLYRTLSRFAEIRPNDLPLQNNLAQVSMLLEVDVDHARKAAADLVQKEPGNAAYVSTYAYSLFSKGDLKGALQVMEGLSPDQLREPSVATYYGLILAAAGEKEKAREFLARSSEAHLLPEEKALVAKANNSLE